VYEYILTGRRNVGQTRKKMERQTPMEMEQACNGAYTVAGYDLFACKFKICMYSELGHT
jgi:hypothetical protein